MSINTVIKMAGQGGRHDDVEVPEVDELRAYLLSNIKSSFTAVSTCLTVHQLDYKHPERGPQPPKDSVELQERIEFYYGLYE